MVVGVTFDIQGVDEFVAAMQHLDKAVQERVRAWLYDWAQRVASEANRNAPERTGYLKSTIYAMVQDWVAEIGASAAYSYFVEFGTRYMMAQPFLYPAVQQLLPELEFNIIGAIEQAKAQAGFGI
jgi:HK97 gp10 family phage protein